MAYPPSERLAFAAQAVAGRCEVAVVADCRGDARKRPIFLADATLERVQERGRADLSRHSIETN